MYQEKTHTASYEDQNGKKINIHLTNDEVDKLKYARKSRDYFFHDGEYIAHNSFFGNIQKISDREKKQGHHVSHDDFKKSQEMKNNECSIKDKTQIRTAVNFFKENKENNEVRERFSGWLISHFNSVVFWLIEEKFGTYNFKKNLDSLISEYGYENIPNKLLGENFDIPKSFPFRKFLK